MLFCIMSEEVFDRIKKLLSLSSSANENEAAIALAMAQKLMQKHNISQKDIELSTIVEQSENTLAGIKDRRYTNKLANIIFKAFGVSGFITSQNAAKSVSITIIGTKDRVNIAKYAFIILSRQLSIVKKDFLKRERTRLKKQYKNNDIFKFINPYNSFYSFDKDDIFLKNSYEIYQKLLKRKIENELRNNTKAYLLGWLDSIKNKVNEFVISKEEYQLIEDYKIKYHPNLISIKITTNMWSQAQHNAYKKGTDDGNTIRLFHGVEGIESKKLNFNR